MAGFLLRAVIAAFGLWLATLWIDGFTIDEPANLLIAAVVLGLFNAVVRPILIVLTLPISVVTLGLFLLVINASIIFLVAAIVPGFDISGFWDALLGALLVSLTGWLGSWFIGSRGLDLLGRR
ncbi:MAG: phage holin family protein [Gammaproteobacteria bacterium]|nr:phage holin family protein [Gammaproteobacteria bacterium]